VTAFEDALRLNPTKMHQSVTLPLVASSLNENDAAAPVALS